MPERQQTLRATVEWSVGLLDDDDRAFLETVAVFVDGWTVDAAAEVAEIDEDAALAVTDALAGHSLINVDLTDRGARSRMLETVRAFLAERLAARPDANDVARRHADHYRAVVEQADRPLRGHAQRVWVERMETEAGNLTAAVRWYVTHDRAPLPHLFRILAQFWILRDHVSEPLSWVDQLLPTAGSLDATAQAELWWTALLVHMETGDDEAALSASEHLTPLLGTLDDGYVKAVSELAMAWAMPILGDYDGALSGTLRALEQFRRLDEPVWTAVALVTAGTFESTLGRRDDAQRHLSEAHDRASQVDSGWVVAWCQVELGIVATEQGRLDDAWALIGEGLSTSLAFHSTSLVTICLGALARLAYAEGNAARSAMLAGAADGMRRRAGLRAWPKLRRPEDSLVEQARQALGTDGFDRAFAAGSRLSRQQALAAARDRSGDETRAVLAAA